MKTISNELFDAVKEWANEPETRRAVEISIDTRIPEASIFIYDYGAMYGLHVTDERQLPSFDECREMKRDNLKKLLEGLDK